ncbi:MAG: lysophospholipid acyltransferase family protein [Spirochaeta sp.]
MIRLFTIITSAAMISLYRLIGLTIRVVDDPMNQLEQQHRNGNHFIFGIWHEFSVIGIYWYRHQRAAALVSDSWKGDVLSRIMHHFGFRAYRTNSGGKERGGIKQHGAGVLGFIRYLREGHDGTIAMDGPLGPARQAKPGILHIAAKSGNFIIPAGAYFSHAIRLKNRWDNYQIPLPFSRLHLVFGEPFEIPDDFRSREPEIIKALNTITNKTTAQAQQRGRMYAHRGRDLHDTGRIDTLAPL